MACVDLTATGPAKRELPEACVVLVFQYQSHFSQFCEPHSYIKLCLSRQWQTSSRDYVTYQPLAYGSPSHVFHRVPIEITTNKLEKIQPSQFSLVVLQFAQTSIEKESAQFGTTVRMAERRTDEVTLSASDVRARLVSKAPTRQLPPLQQLKSNSGKFTMTIDLAESGVIWQGKWQASLAEWMSRDWTTEDDKTIALQMLGQQQLHNLCLSTNHHYYKMPAVVPFVDSSSGDRGDDETSAALQAHLLSTDDKLFLNNHLRSFNNSYVHMASCQQLPGCSYLRLHEPSHVDRIPDKWFKFHSQWAVRRLSRSPGADSDIIAALERVAQATDDGVGRGDSSWLNSVQEHDLIVAIEWFSELLCFVPRMHPYLKDCLDRCNEEDIKARLRASMSSSTTGGSHSSQLDEQLAGRAHVGDVASTWWASAAGMTPKMVECAVKEIREATDGIRKRTSPSAGPQASRETFARLARAECKSAAVKIQHVIEDTDKFVALWGGRYPYMSADDCESMFISIFMLWRQLMWAQEYVRRANETSEHIVDEAKGIDMWKCKIQASAKKLIAKGLWMWPIVRALTDPAVAYVPVMLNCAILRSISEPVDIYTELQRQLARERTEHAQHCVQCWEKPSGAGGAAAARHVCMGQISSSAHRMYPFRVGDSRTSDKRLICHVMMLAIPAARLSLWIQRGIDYRKAVEEATSVGQPVQYMNRHGCPFGSHDGTDHGHGWHRLPNLVMEGTEYSVAQQHLLNSPGSGLPNSLRERDDLQTAFLQHFRATFPRAPAFQVRHPRSVTDDYNLMAYAISAHSTDMDRLHGVSEFVFVDARTRRQAVPFANLVRSPAFQMDSLQDWIVAMPVSGSRFLPPPKQPPQLAGDQKLPALLPSRSSTTVLEELVAQVCHGEPFAAPPPVSGSESEWNLDKVDHERQQHADSKFVTTGTKEHVRLYVREIDWECVGSTWTKWIQQEQAHGVHAPAKTRQRAGPKWSIGAVHDSWMPVFDDFRVREIVIEIVEVV